MSLPFPNFDHTQSVAPQPIMGVITTTISGDSEDADAAIPVITRWRLWQITHTQDETGIVVFVGVLLSDGRKINVIIKTPDLTDITDTLDVTDVDLVADFQNTMIKSEKGIPVFVWEIEEDDEEDDDEEE